MKFDPFNPMHIALFEELTRNKKTVNVKVTYREQPKYTDQHNNRFLNYIYILYKKISKFVF